MFMQFVKLDLLILVDFVRDFFRLFAIYNLTLKEKSTLGDIMTFTFTSNKKIRYSSGQYGIWMLKRWVWGKPGRLFTLASPSGDNKVQVSTHISKTDFKQKFSRLEVGQSVLLIGPIGNFIVSEPPPKQIVMVAGGIGITPMRAIAKDLFQKQAETAMTLIHSARSEYLYRDEMETYCSETHFTSREDFAETCARVVEKAGVDAPYYISGPPKFVIAAENELRAKNVKTIKKDGFIGY